MIVVKLWTKKLKLIKELRLSQHLFRPDQVEQLFCPWFVFRRAHSIEITEEEATVIQPRDLL